MASTRKPSVAAFFACRLALIASTKLAIDTTRLPEDSHKSDDDCYVGHGQVLPVARKILDPAPSPINRSFLRWLSRYHFFAIGPGRE